MEEQVNKDTIVKSVEELDPSLKKSDEAFKIATILLAGLQTGPDSEKIAKFLELPLEDVQKYEKRLRDQEIWVGDKTACDWFNEESGSIAFWMDVNVAQGYMEKVKKN